jgi:HK97 family phage prohead protease
MKRKFLLSGAHEVLGDREVRVVASTGDVDRTGEMVEPAGIDLSGFLANPIILWQHDPEHPIGNATRAVVQGGKLICDIEFAPAGTSKKADEICGLVKAGILKGVSIGFDPIETEPMTAGNSRGPQKYVAIDLMEVSIVSIPANVGAAVVQRSHRPGAKREGRTISVSTQAALESAQAELKAGMAHFAAAKVCMTKFSDICNELLASSDDAGGGGGGKALTVEERRALTKALRSTEPFQNYPEHLRGDSPYHYAARANFDEFKSRQRV